jgi:hypothetical protein
MFESCLHRDLLSHVDSDAESIHHARGLGYPGSLQIEPHPDPINHTQLNMACGALHPTKTLHSVDYSSHPPLFLSQCGNLKSVELIS